MFHVKHPLHPEVPKSHDQGQRGGRDAINAGRLRH